MPSNTKNIDTQEYTGANYFNISRFRSIEKILAYKLKTAKRSMKILDLGCGDGELSQHINKSHKNCSWYGVDKFNKLSSTNTYVSFSQIDLDEVPLHLPFEKDFFDIIICSEVLEHLYNPENVYAEIGRLLAPTNSMVVLSTPNLQYLQHRLQAPTPGEVVYDHTIRWVKEHIRWFTPQTHIKYLKENTSCTKFRVFGTDAEMDPVWKTLVNNLYYKRAFNYPFSKEDAYDLINELFPELMHTCIVVGYTSAIRYF